MTFSYIYHCSYLLPLLFIPLCPDLCFILSSIYVKHVFSLQLKKVLYTKGSITDIFNWLCDLSFPAPAEAHVKTKRAERKQWRSELVLLVPVDACRGCFWLFPERRCPWLPPRPLNIPPFSVCWGLQPIVDLCSLQCAHISVTPPHLVPKSTDGPLPPFPLLLTHSRPLSFFSGTYESPMVLLLHTSCCDTSIGNCAWGISSPLFSTPQGKMEA